MTNINLWSLGRATAFMGMGIVLASSLSDSMDQAFEYPRDAWLLAAGAGFGIAMIGLCLLAIDLAARIRNCEPQDQ